MAVDDYGVCGRESGVGSEEKVNNVCVWESGVGSWDLGKSKHDVCGWVGVGSGDFRGKNKQRIHQVKAKNAVKFVRMCACGRPNCTELVHPAQLTTSSQLP